MALIEQKEAGLAMIGVGGGAEGARRQEIVTEQSRYGGKVTRW